MIIMVSGCDKNQSTGPVAPDSATLELVSLNTVQDESHTILLNSRDGIVWYREYVPGFDVRHCDFEATRVDKVYGTGFGLGVAVRESHWQKLRRWSRERVGKQIGFVFDGQLIAVERLESPFGSHVYVPGFETERDAYDALDKLRAVATSLAQRDNGE